MPAPSVFYIPNLEYCDQNASNIIGTHQFQLQQYDLNVIWHIIEGQPAVSRCIDVELKNIKYFTATSLIDFASSIQLTFDVICQLGEVRDLQNCFDLIGIVSQAYGKHIYIFLDQFHSDSTAYRKVF